MKNLGEILKEHRLIRKLTLKDIEKGTGINNGSLSRWERNEVLPSITACVQLAEFFEITLDELVGLDDDFGARVAAPMSDTERYSEEERKLIEDYRALNYSGKKLVKQTVETLRATSAQSEQKKKNS